MSIPELNHKLFTSINRTSSLKTVHPCELFVTDEDSQTVWIVIQNSGKKAYYRQLNANISHGKSFDLETLVHVLNREFEIVIN